jgi:hypothetical protein
MKYRIMTAIASCWLSSLALADNPADARLVPNDATTMVVQRENDTRDNRWHANKKGESSPKTNCKTVSQNNQKDEPGKSEGFTTAKN